MAKGLSRAWDKLTDLFTGDVTKLSESVKQHSPPLRVVLPESLTTSHVHGFRCNHSGDCFIK